ncbi:multi-sensor signal transduction histidine kinase [Sulfurimonas gotlandica GD1]|uniref:histidine kinase n=1 Tax=Sulfurimonas gotlandica (strain DSM 19862 / JCM 16533 / GD1) TaxID=929558 RepID=B6BN76_SULGG|nr:response regulator [Sulfurimonas gotlandica]EDZ61361.1 multi-sensor signal transduction histidine kinase [Sulfurimonas gotlandica GD1]EHP30944.1 multi-sensor signal transduction histidine kinase [Sulfurimonas gotlandica GD1]
MTKKKLAVIFEESKTIQLFYKNLITPLGYEVLSVGSFTELKDLLNKDTAVDLALISLDSDDKPEVTVKYVVKKGIPVILLSGEENPKIRENLVKEDVVDYIDKFSISNAEDTVKLLKRLEINQYETILVVDDSALFRLMISNLLRRHKFHVLEAEDGKIALNILNKNPDINLVITDYEMPNMNGLELIKSVRNNHKLKDIPMIVISSVDAQSTIVDCMKHGANDYLHKPFSKGEFYSRLYITLTYKENMDLVAEQKEVYEKLFYQSSNATVIMEDNKYIDCNEAVLKLLKLENKEAILNKKPCDFSPERQPDGSLSSDIMKKIINESIMHYEWEHLKSDSTSVIVDVIRTQIPIKGKEVLHVLLHDITAMKKLESDLESLNLSLEQRVREEVKKNEEQSSHMLQQSRLAQMGEMISMIAHQWRQPLASISAISGTLTLDIMMDQYKADFFQERLESINELSQHLSSTIDDFRGFFKEEKIIKKIEIKELINSSIDIIGPTLKTKNINIKLIFNEDITVETYINEVRQVLLNILKNAEDILQDKEINDAFICISGYKDEEYVYLVVEDNAGGVPDDIIKNIFEPYFSTKIAKDGTGLGLYMSKTIIEDHCKGSLKVENSEDGARFTIALPINTKEIINAQ